ncbi:MAG: Hsp20/alpha crystallin family protein [Rhodospirillales bacterium]|nr:Hsp20/alpha crystallin family protein [Rhodospirillales bacterium]
MAFGPHGFGHWEGGDSPLRRLQEDINRAFGDMRWPQAVEFPPMNLWRGPEGVIVTAEVPGIGLQDMEITVHQNALIIKGRREQPTHAAGVSYHRQEREYGPFARTVTLPFNVDPDSVKATAQNGVLMIELPRPEADKPKRIQIRAV